MPEFVSLLGNDITGTGTILAPWRTPTKGLQECALGDFVYMRGGTYTNTVSNPTGITYGTQESERITFKNYDDEPVTMKPGAGQIIFQLKGDIAFFTLKGITFDGANLTAAQTQMVKIWTQGVTDITDIIIEDNGFLNAPDLAFQFDSLSDSWTFQRNTILNAGRDDGGDLVTSSLYARGLNHIIQDNVIGSTHAHSQTTASVGLRYYTNALDGGHDSDNGIIRRNYIYGINTGIVVGTGANMQVFNNLIRDCDNRGVQIYSQSGRATDNIKVYHNTIVHPTGMTNGVIVVPSVGAVTNSLIRNNIIRRATTAVDVSDDTGTPVTTDNYTGTSPGFYADGGTAIADYILTGAPATVNGGADLRSDVPTDFYGNTRDATPDQGFFELTDPAAPEWAAEASYSGNAGANITFDPQVTDEDGDASIVYVNRRNRVTVDITFTAGTSTIVRGD